VATLFVVDERTIGYAFPVVLIAALASGTHDEHQKWIAVATVLILPSRLSSVR
jgi:hypothetical protein